MNIAESFRIALRALNANKVRSALTMLGVIIGVAAVILLVSLGSGIQSEITGQIEGMGANVLFAFPGDMTSGGQMITRQFTQDDVEYLKSRMGAKYTIVPEIEAAGTVRVRNKSAKTYIIATEETVRDSVFGKLQSGRWFSRGEAVGAARVAILGVGPREKMYPSQNPLGTKIKVNGIPFEVIGTLESRGGGMGGTQDDLVLIPISSAQQILNTKNISEIFIRTPDSKNMNAAKAQVERALRPRFGDQLTVMSQEQALSMFSTILGMLTATLAGLASISLLVGGIGIMNIMLVSVSERTREIGIRKAVGARTYDILSQFVIEAVVLSVLGGGIGIALGAGGAMALHKWVPAEVTPWAVALAFIFSACVGIFFGVYPAWRASRLDPIVALRYE